MAYSACTSEDVNIQPACQLAAHACRKQLIFTLNAFVILKKKATHMQNAILKDSSLHLSQFSSGHSQGLLREACAPLQAGSAGIQFLYTVYRIFEKLKINVRSGRSAFFLPQTQHAFMFAT